MEVRAGRQMATALCLPALLLCLVTSTSLAGVICSPKHETNITDGVAMSAKHFVVTLEDCCQYCSRIDGCVAATYQSFFCTPYSLVSSTAPSPAGTVVTISTAPPTTTGTPTTTTTTTTTVQPTPAATTQPPTTTAAPTPSGPPKGYAFLTTCPISTACSRLYDANCVTEVVPLHSCALRLSDNSYVTVDVESVEGGIERIAYNDSSCSGEVSSRTFFPDNCTFADSVNRMGTTAAWYNQSGEYNVEMQSCSDAMCDECTTYWWSATGMCIEGGSNRGSSSSGEGSGAYSSNGGIAPSHYEISSSYCVGGYAAVFPYLSYQLCEANVRMVGEAVPSGKCFYNNADMHFQAVCKENPPQQP